VADGAGADAAPSDGRGGPLGAHSRHGCQELIVNRSVSFRRAALSAALVVLAQVALAQTAKPPPRLPPSPSEASRIPGGVDTGTPGGSDSLQLGTPVMSNATGQPSAFRGGSAAARAAARPKPTASSADCTRPLEPASGDLKAASAPLPKPGLIVKAKPAPTKPPVAPGATRIDC
jgi:hypothetical protein